MIWLLLVVLQFGGLVYYLLQKTLVTRKPLVEVSIVHSTFPFALLFLFVCFFFLNLIFLVTRIITMRENKEKNITSGDEDATAPPVDQKTSVQAGKRKAKPISTHVDLDVLPSR